MHTTHHASPFPSSGDTDTHPPYDSAALDVLVVGAGQAGLSMAWHLSRRNVRFLVVDAARDIGHSWRTRWDSLRLFSPSQYDGLPGQPFPGAPDTYPGKDEVADYLAVYAEQNAFPVLTDTRVTRLVPQDGGFHAHTSQGVLSAHQVVVATGAFHVPHVPGLSAGFDPSVSQVHSSSYRNPSRLPGGRVLVVGAGNSGLQIAGELAAAGREVILAAGTHPPALPQRVGGRDLFWWLLRLGLMDKPADSRLARRIRARGDLVIGTSRRRLARDGVDLRPRLVGADGATAHFADGSASPVDVVVWATGFAADYSWIDAPLLGPDGRVQHQEGRSTVPGLWFLGLPWQRTRGSSLLGFVHRDAEDLAARMLPAHQHS
jgi:putative flavoprotein involved in K+ transport